MYKLYPYFTNDGSVGLFSPEADDIYHSTYGALTEAYEKFVLPANVKYFLKNNSQIKILDICYGIGYNTKSFLNYFLEKFFSNFEIKNEKIFNNKANIDKIYSNNIYNREIYTDNIEKNSETLINIDTIDNDNVLCEHSINSFQKIPINPHLNNEALYSNNLACEKSLCSRQKYKIFIKALDNDKTLLILSPFFRQGNEDDKKYNNLNFNYEKISKLLNNKFEAKYKLNPAINFALLYKICNKLPEIIGNSEISNILDSNEYKPFFDSEIMACFKKINESDVSEYPQEAISSFLHNIYYNHISTSYKIVLEYLISDNFIFEPVIGDARTSLINDKDTYNLIFLDAFTPAKCPCLWTLEFFKLLYEHLSEDGMILTYSNSASIRNAMLNAGFYAGKIYNNEFNKFTGTIAVKNKSLIKFELSEYDLGLINSKAGIFYHDKNLNLSNGEILASHKSEVEKSCKMSSSRFIKEFKKKNCL